MRNDSDLSGMSLTSAELKDELDRFAEAVFKPYMTQMARSMRKIVREEIRRSSNKSKSKRSPGGCEIDKPIASAVPPSLLCCTSMLTGPDDWEIPELEQCQINYGNAIGDVGRHNSISSISTAYPASQAAVLAELREDRRFSDGYSTPVIQENDRRMCKCTCALALVQSVWFERAVSLVILLNGFWIGFVTEYMAQQELRSMPRAFTIVEYNFLGFFALEFGIRFLVCGLALFRPAGHHDNPLLLWNYFDAVVILLQVLEVIFESVLSSFYVIRVIRLVRLVRIIRLVKVLRFVRELRVIVYSIWMSGALFAWSVVAMLLMNFMCSIVFTDYVLDRKINTVVDDQEKAYLNTHFGSLYRTMFSLFKSVTGGEDWGNLMNALGSDEIPVQLLFTAYVAFTLFAMLNVISGIFLETAMESVRDEREMYVMRNARVLFKTIDHTGNGTISWKDFEYALDHQHMRSFLEAIDVRTSDARNLFNLLDASGDQMISSDEFLSGCLRLRGPSKSLDLLVLSKELHQLVERYSYN